MINLAVIDLKDIVKYLIKITVIIVIVVALTKFFSSFKTKLNTEKNPFLECLDTVVPSISTVNKKETAIAETGKIEPLKMALGIELGVIDSLEKNGTETKNQRRANRCKKSTLSRIAGARSYNSIR